MGFKLNTESMDSAAKSCNDLYEKMRDLKENLISTETDLLDYWYGKGRNEFEKQFRLLKNQLSDISETLLETSEKILNAEEAYLQADTDAAKMIEGRSEGELDSADEFVENALE